MIVREEGGFTIIEPDKGKKLTTLIPSKKVFELLYLGIEDSVSNYIEITDEEYIEEIEEEEEEIVTVKDELMIAKEELIKRSKTKLKNILKNSPVLYEGKYYTCTLEKQNILYNRIKLYEIREDKQEKILWNAMGEEYIEWDYQDILKLACAIENHVTKLVKEQQKEEVEINKCATMEELLYYQSSFPM